MLYISDEPNKCGEKDKGIEVCLQASPVDSHYEHLAVCCWWERSAICPLTYLSEQHGHGLALSSHVGICEAPA